VADTKKINIGCGAIHHPDWINLDVSSNDPSVLSVDVTQGLPFKDSFISVCYSSHVLEHLEKKAAAGFVGECFRVLRSGGVIRLVVPDLEVIAREYLKQLEAADSASLENSPDYDWITLEMYDQVARNKPGGEMVGFLTNLPETQRDYVRSRIGAEASHIWESETSGERGSALYQGTRWSDRLKRWKFNLTGRLVWIICGKSALESFRRGVFRDSGEVHQWMYDRYSLKQLLAKAGFVDIKVCAPNESRITDYEKYGLDMKDGFVRKPDSLFIEASKP
jgi:predicted SAM-dependent methyltransferase